MDIRHILAPTDFSDYSKKALSDALDLAQTFGATLSLLHVIEPPPYPIEGFVPPAMGADLLADLERQASAALAQVLPEAQRQKSRSPVRWRWVRRLRRSSRRPRRHTWTSS